MKSKMIKVLIVFGTRPEAIKMAPLVKQFQAENGRFKTIVCVTAQHREWFKDNWDLIEKFADFPPGMSSAVRTTEK